MKTHQLIKDIIKAGFSYKIQDFNNLENNIDRILNNPKTQTSKEKWSKLEEMLKEYEEKISKNSNKYTTKYSRSELCLNEIKLNFLYPRLDINVSKHLNHLLKAPFCVHPKTGMVSVPLNRNDIFNFSLENIPNIFSCIDDHKNKK